MSCVRTGSRRRRWDEPRDEPRDEPTDEPTDKPTDEPRGESGTRWGWVATGGIAATVAGDLALTPGAIPLAVASSSGLARARAFADEHGFERAYGSAAALAADPDIDAIYIATPHAQHREAAELALLAGTPVLVEKPLTSSSQATRALVGLARERGVFAMEAVWTRFQPLVLRLRELLADGEIGDVRRVSADLGFRHAQADDPQPVDRFWDPAAGGGALLDMGLYPVALAQMVLGAPRRVQVAGSLAATGVDAEASLLLDYAGGAAATLSTSLLATQPSEARIIGTRGWIEVASPHHHPHRLTVHREGAEPEVLEAPAERGGGYVPQLTHVQECLEAGLTESPLMPLDDTLAIAEVLEQALLALGATRSQEVSA